MKTNTFGEIHYTMRNRTSKMAWLIIIFCLLAVHICSANQCIAIVSNKTICLNSSSKYNRSFKIIEAYCVQPDVKIYDGIYDYVAEGEANVKYQSNLFSLQTAIDSQWIQLYVEHKSNPFSVTVKFINLTKYEVCIYSLKNTILNQNYIKCNIGDTSILSEIGTYSGFGVTPQDGTWGAVQFPDFRDGNPRIIRSMGLPGEKTSFKEYLKKRKELIVREGYNPSDFPITGGIGGFGELEYDGKVRRLVTLVDVLKKDIRVDVHVEVSVKIKNGSGEEARRDMILEQMRKQDSITKLIQGLYDRVISAQGGQLYNTISEFYKNIPRHTWVCITRKPYRRNTPAIKGGKPPKQNLNQKNNNAKNSNLSSKLNIESRHFDTYSKKAGNLVSEADVEFKRLILNSKRVVFDSVITTNQGMFIYITDEK